KAFSSLALAPVSVHPDFQGKGIGGQLIEEAHRIARELDYGSIVLLGHADYYPRFGYRPIHQYNIKLPFEAPPENCMVVELKAGALEEVNGEVVYDAAFFE
ncbi:MAG: N-acetyltransferase, partial [Bacteroidota bacterium]